MKKYQKFEKLENCLKKFNIFGNCQKSGIVKHLKNYQKFEKLWKMKIVKNLENCKKNWKIVKKN